MIFRRSDSIHPFESSYEADGVFVAHFFVDGLDGHVAIVLLIVKAAGCLTQTILVEQRLEILVVVFVDHLRHIFGVGSYGLGKFL